MQIIDIESKFLKEQEKNQELINQNNTYKN